MVIVKILPGLPNWHFSASEIELNSPSRHDGVSYKDEMKMKVDMCNHLQRLGARLQVPQASIAAAATYLHRFSMRCSLLDFNLKILPSACMYLACKTEETGRRANDIITFDFRCTSQSTGSSASHEKEILVEEEVAKRRELLAMYERILLQVLCFELHVDHPYSYLLKFVHVLFHEKQRELIQVAWNFINDSYMRSNLCLLYSPDHIALACIQLAATYLQDSIPSLALYWYQDAPFHLREVDMKDILTQLCSMYNEDVRSIDQIVQHHLEKAREREKFKMEERERERALTNTSVALGSSQSAAIVQDSLIPVIPCKETNSVNDVEEGEICDQHAAQ